MSDGVNLQHIGCSVETALSRLVPQRVHRVTSPSIKLRYVTHIGPGTRVHNWPANP